MKATAERGREETASVNYGDDDITPVRARKCAYQGCENVIVAGAGAPMFCAEEHDDLNP